MKFRPCIDLRQGKVTQIVGSTLSEATTKTGDATAINFVSEKPPAYFASLYKEHELTGGHIIMLGPGNTEGALSALKAYPRGMQVGGGITPTNAASFLDAGASHVIVTSFIFAGDGELDFEKLRELVQVVGKDRLVLDLSCRKKAGEGPYYVVTDRWQKSTSLEVNQDTMIKLAGCCSEFLVHGVDVEGKQQGIEEELVVALGKWSPIPVTYAGGVRSLEDLALVKRLGGGKVDITVGSALDIFGGSLPFEDVLSVCDRV